MKLKQNILFFILTIIAYFIISYLIIDNKNMSCSNKILLLIIIIILYFTAIFKNKENVDNSEIKLNNLESTNLNIIKPTGNGYKKFLNSLFPIGYIYLTTNNNVKPQDMFGGKWVLLNSSEGKNRFLVTAGGSGIYNTTKKKDKKTYYRIGGEETVKLTFHNLPSHTHYFYPYTENTDWSGNTETGQIRINTKTNYGHKCDNNGQIGRCKGNDYKVIGRFYTSDKEYTTKEPSWHTNHDIAPMKQYYDDTTKNTSEYVEYPSYKTTQGHNNIPPYKKIYAWKKTAN